jgi:hypothetical protein
MGYELDSRYSLRIWWGIDLSIFKLMAKASHSVWNPPLAKASGNSNMTYEIILI